MPKSIPLTDLLSPVSDDPMIVNGRYKIPEPIITRTALHGDTVEPNSENPKDWPTWQRATNLAKVIADTFMLNQWKIRMTVTGYTLRPDLLELASTLDVSADRIQFDQINKDAEEAARASAGRNMGSALHRATEHYDRANHQALERLSRQMRADVHAYRHGMAAYGLEVEPAWMERVVVDTYTKCAGRYDRIVRVLDNCPVDGLAPGELSIFDLKTAERIEYGWLEIAIQLALYANAPVTWDHKTETFDFKPNVSKKIALVGHLPPGQQTFKLYVIDIAKGWRWAQLAMDVRAARSDKDVATLIHPKMELGESGIDWKSRLDQAKTRSELKRVRAEAEELGEWTPYLLTYAVERLHAEIRG